MLRAKAFPGVEMTMPLLFPGFARDWGNAVERFSRPHHPDRPRRHRP